MSKLANKVAVVTGASKGIGADIAKSLAAEGAAVVVNYASSKEGADKVVAAITAKGGKAIAIQGDVSKQADITRLFAETKKAFGQLLPPGSATYSATKASVDAITVILSKELGAKNIRVNAINPGLVETEGVHTAGFLGSDFEKGIVAQTPLGRIGQPDDISPAAVFLASADSKYMTGQTLNISGGIR